MASSWFMFNLKHSLATVGVAGAVLATAGSASAANVTYNGHAGLGASVYQHDQTDLDAVADGTSNTMMFGARGAAFILMADSGGQFY